MIDFDEIDDEEENEGWGPMLPVDDQGVRIMAEKCDTCIFHPGNRMMLEPGRVASMVADIKAGDSYIPCHKSLGNFMVAICHGGNVAHESQLVRSARRMNAIHLVSQEEAERGENVEAS